MRHSVFAGGKRLRPVLCMEAARMVAGDGELPAGVADLGAALEMLHTYSLIHDDLPALDNDDLRRGQPTCHVAFGEAIAILAGDALQTLAFQTLAQLRARRAARRHLARSPSPSAPASARDRPGMIGGQVVDIESEDVKPNRRTGRDHPPRQDRRAHHRQHRRRGLYAGATPTTSRPPAHASAAKPASPSRLSTTSST